VPETSKKLPFEYLQKAEWHEAPCAVPEAWQKTHALWRVLSASGERNLFTGYYEPVLRGSLTREGPYLFPLYAPPQDLIRREDGLGEGRYSWGRMASSRLIPHVSRAEVEAGALAGQGLELLYGDDPVDLFFLHVQGSGKIQLPDGTFRRVSFAGKSGHPYSAIGKILREEERLQLATMADIKNWLRANPRRLHEILNRNASYIFFKFIEGDGPVGAAGEVLLPEQSLAVDDTIWPYGLDVIVETKDPLDPSKNFTRLMKTVDTGSAIRGRVRGDIFFGSGEKAGKKAGAMAAAGCLWIILPR
jgi:membrane-bound lytic murein transglycosylase A